VQATGLNQQGSVILGCLGGFSCMAIHQVCRRYHLLPIGHQVCTVALPDRRPALDNITVARAGYA
jgi:hypothetical protein